jgi:hypothetical protein
MKKKAPEPTTDPRLDLLNGLLGTVEDMTPEELASAIADAGIDLRAARERLYARVSDVRSKLWDKNAEVKSDITSLLTQFRPSHLPTADPRTAQHAAAQWVRDLIDARTPAADSIEFATAARNLDGALTDSDRDIMRELEEELRNTSDDSE